MKLKFKEVYENNKEKFIEVGGAALLAIGIAGLSYGSYKIGRATMTNDIGKELRILYTANPELNKLMNETITKVNSQKG